MSQRPTIQKPTPLTTSQPESQQQADPIMGGINIPKFSADMQAEVSPEAAPLWNFVTTHARKIAAGIVSLVVVISLIAVWQWYREKQFAESQSQLGRICAMQDSGKRVPALEAFLKDAPEKLKISAWLELAAAASDNADWAKAADAFARVIEKEGDTPLGANARMNRAQLLVRKGDFAEARSEFHALVGNVPTNLKPLLHQMAAEAAEAAGDKAGAIADYEAALSSLPHEEKTSSAFFRTRIAALKK